MKFSVHTGVGCKAVIRPTAIHSAQVRVPAGTHPVELQAPDIKLRSWIFQTIGERTCSLSFRNQCVAPIFQVAAGAATSLPDHAAFFDFATWVAIASISAGDRQSYGSSPNSLRRERMPAMSSGLTPDSITDDTNAANPGAAEPASWNSSGWMKSRP